MHPKFPVWVVRDLVKIKTVKTLIIAQAFIRIVTFHREGVGVYKKLEWSQSIFEKPKHSVCFITSVPCLAILYELLLPVEICL